MQNDTTHCVGARVQKGIQNMNSQGRSAFRHDLS